MVTIDKPYTQAIIRGGFWKEAFPGGIVKGELIMYPEENKDIRRTAFATGKRA